MEELNFSKKGSISLLAFVAGFVPLRWRREEWMGAAVADETEIGIIDFGIFQMRSH